MAATAAMSMTSVIIVVFVVNDLLSPVVLTILMVSVGIGIAFVDPTWQAIIPDVVPVKLLSKAVTLCAATNSGVWALGSALAGIMLPTLGVTWVFSVSVVGYVTMFVTAAMLGRLPSRPSTAPSTHTLVLAAIRHVRFSRHLRTVLLTVVLFGFAGVSVQALLPSISSVTLGGGERYYGALVTGFGFGSVVGVATRAPANQRLKSRTVPVAATMFGISAGTVAVSHDVWPSTAAMVVAGAMWTWVLATLNGTLQMLTPEWIRGRIIALYVVTLLGSMTVGSILAGLTGEVAGPSRALAVWSLCIVAVSAAAGRLALPDVDRIEKEELAGWRQTHAPQWAAQRTLMVMTVWRIDEIEQKELLVSVGELRAIRMRSGALDWKFYRDVDHENEFVEVIHVHDWREYQLMTERLTVEAAKQIRAASALDRRGAPCRHHYVEMDVPGDV
jgi:MFS family permease